MPRVLVHLLTTLAFLASLFAVPLAPVKKGGAAFDAARLAVMHVAKPTPGARKTERTRAPGLALAPGLLVAAVPASHLARNVEAPPTTWTAPALDRTELMVFLI